MRAALRRFSMLFLVIAGGTAVVALLLGIALGAGVSRSLSLGWYISGSTILIGGFFVGNRGASRPRGEGWSAFSTRRWVRWASAEEQRESVSLSAILVVLGFLVIVLGVLADNRSPLT